MNDRMILYYPVRAINNHKMGRVVFLQKSTQHPRNLINKLKTAGKHDQFHHQKDVGNA
jgi:hypothetical protein